MTKITLQVTAAEVQLIRLALCNVSVASSNFVKADRLQQRIGQSAELHKLAQKNMKRIRKP